MRKQMFGRPSRMWSMKYLFGSSRLSIRYSQHGEKGVLKTSP